MEELKQDAMRKRAKQMIDELSLPVTRFCRNVGISTSTYYKWQAQTIDISISMLHLIDDYIVIYGF